MYTLIISIGLCCEASTAIRRANARYKPRHQFASALDWVLVYSVDEMIELFEKDFEPLDTLENGMRVVPDLNVHRLCVRGYNVYVPHYTRVQWKESIPRRRERMMEFLRTAGSNAGERVLFVFKSHLTPCSRMTQGQCDRLVGVLHAINPELRYDMLVVNEFMRNEKPVPIVHDRVIDLPFIQAQDVEPELDASAEPIMLSRCDFKTERGFWNIAFETCINRCQA